MTTRQLYPVQIAGKRYSPEFQSEQEYERGWQSVLAKAHAGHLEVRCTCSVTPAPLMYVRCKNDAFHLARYPDSGPEHAPDCAHYDQIDALDDGGHDEAEPERIPPEAVAVEDHLACSLPIPFAMPQEDAASRSSRRSTLASLLDDLWAASGLTDWKPQWTGTRTLYRVRRRLLQAAERITVNGEPLAQNLIVGAVSADEDGRRCNGDRVQKANRSRRRLLALARLAKPRSMEAGLDALRATNFHGMPWIVVDDMLRDEMAARQPALIMHWRAGEPTFFLAMIEPPADGGRDWKAISIALFPTNHDYVPVAPAVTQTPLREFA